MSILVVADDLTRIAGLPAELGIDQELDKEAQRVTVRIETRRYGKAVTVIEGFDTTAIDVEELASRLKRKLATGGTGADGRVELQGDHARRVREVLQAEGYEVD